MKNLLMTLGAVALISAPVITLSTETKTVIKIEENKYQFNYFFQDLKPINHKNYYQSDEQDTGQDKYEYYEYYSNYHAIFFSHQTTIDINNNLKLALALIDNKI